MNIFTFARSKWSTVGSCPLWPLEDFIVSVMLQQPDVGGEFEFAPMLRGPNGEENYEKVWWSWVHAGTRDSWQVGFIWPSCIPWEDGKSNGVYSLARIRRCEDLPCLKNIWINLDNRMFDSIRQHDCWAGYLQRSQPNNCNQSADFNPRSQVN